MSNFIINNLMETIVKQKVEPASHSTPKFIDKIFLQKEQISDPDYRLKFLEKLYGNKYTISCSKCHHCR
ncbi:MAG TPA: hypothetical protein VMV32_00495 [Ignavibacteriaceae bacterium]|nr:hypothetical protein [Ignavibacteriaceae bacterium]